MGAETTRNEGQRLLSELASAQTQARLAAKIRCSQGHLSKLVSGEKDPNDELKERMALAPPQGLGIPVEAWSRPSAPRPPPPPSPRAAAPPAGDRPGLALERTLARLDELASKLDEATDTVEWNRLARTEAGHLRTLAELQGDLGNGRELRLRAELDAAKRDMERLVATVRAALRSFPDAARAVAAELKRLDEERGGAG